jgi:hypothetical protein
MDDLDIIARIDELAGEEHRLERSHAGQPLDDAELARLRDLGVALDRCWDLLRQRRARRAAGQDPEHTAARPTSIVEGYQQ